MLVIMDGWGWREEIEGNAVKIANTPNIDRYCREYPFTLLKASGEAVGLPSGQMGNSEVGHLNIGAGRIVYQELTRINTAIKDGSFFRNQVLLDIIDKVLAGGSTLHLMGLVSDGGVHSEMDHLFAIIKMARDRGLKKVCVHAFMDGRDTLPTSGAGYIRGLLSGMEGLGLGKIATVIGRYYAMDRDKRWDRIELAYKAMVRGEGHGARDPVKAIEESYSRGETDEFIRPIIITDTPMHQIRDRDGVIFFNFRADRARELTRAFTDPDFSEFDVHDRPGLAGFVCLTQYDEHFDLPVAFPPPHLEHILGQEVSEAGLWQFRIAETEKYAHVTYFFNGGEEMAFPKEDRCLIPSPREVATYDQKPEMSARLITAELLRRIGQDRYSLIVVNFANGDMVGHTGNLAAAIEACEVVDQCVGQITEAWRALGHVTIVTADHGNAEVMLTPDHRPATSHTTSPVPLYLIDDLHKGIHLDRGILADIAPTILAMQGLAIPEAMTGKVLFRQ